MVGKWDGQPNRQNLPPCTYQEGMQCLQPTILNSVHKTAEPLVLRRFCTIIAYSACLFLATLHNKYDVYFLKMMQQVWMLETLEQ